MVKEMNGKLFVCATPIGNLKDITIRVIQALKEVDLIAAEDTRQTRKLCTRYKIRRPLISYHKFNEKTRCKELIDKLKSGERIALVSDAGTPGLSDPGHRLIKECIQVNIPVEVLPGPNAAIAALVISGLPTNRFAFEGFLPRKKGERRRTLAKLASEERTLVIYESPHRIVTFLKDMAEVFGARKIVLVRELTKKFEEIIRGNIEEVMDFVERSQLKGEIVLIIEGRPKEVKEYSNAFIEARVNELIERGFSRKDAITEIAKSTRLARRIIYEKIKN